MQWKYKWKNVAATESFVTAYRQNTFVRDSTRWLVAETARDTSLAIGIGNFLLGSLFGHSIWPQGHARYIIQGPVHWVCLNCEIALAPELSRPTSHRRPHPPTHGTNLQNQLHTVLVLGHRCAKYPGKVNYSTSGSLIISKSYKTNMGIFFNLKNKYIFKSN